MHVATVLSIVLEYGEGVLPINSDGSLKTWSHDIKGQIKNIISTPTMPRATKFGRVVAYQKGIQRSCEITWKIKNVVSPVQ